MAAQRRRQQSLERSRGVANGETSGVCLFVVIFQYYYLLLTTTY